MSRFRARYAETDAMGIVHHASYLIWFEVGRSDLLRQAGAAYTAFEARGIHSPVVEVHVRYRSPARYDDRILVETRLAAAGSARIRFDYAIYREADEARTGTGSAAANATERTLLVEGQSVHCFLDADGRPLPLRSLPEELRLLLQAAAAPRDAAPGGIADQDRQDAWR